MIALVNLLFEIITLFIRETTQFMLDIIISIIPQKRKTDYDADFIPAHKALTVHENGFCLDGKRSLSTEDSFSNAICFGGSGSGKSSRILIPSILKMAGHASLVIHDPSRELFEKTSGALAAHGYTIQVINYSNPTISEGFNPLQRAQTISDIQKIASAIIRNTLGEAKDPFWNRSSEALIAFFARYLTQYAEPKYRTLNNVLYLINTFGASPEKVDKLIVCTADEMLIADYKALVAYESRTLMGIIATARAALSLFSDPSIARITAHDSIDFESFIRQKTALFINNSIKDIRYYSSISSIFFEQFFGTIMDRIPSEKEMPIFFLLDEASSLHVGSLPNTINNIRKSRAGMLLIYQHYNQMVDLYGHAQARTIAANCYAKVYMSGQPIEIAHELEQILGKFQFDDEGTLRVRPLMTADEIRQLRQSIILCGNMPPILATMTPYYEQRELKKLSVMPAYDINQTIAFDEPPLIPFEHETNS